MESESITCDACGRVWPKPRFDFVCRCNAPYVPEAKLDCIHRSESIGIADCGCAGKPMVHWCSLLNGHCTVRGSGKPWHKIQTDAKLIRREGRLMPCVVCPKRNYGKDFVRLEQPTILCDLPDPKNDRALITVAPDAHTQSELRFTRKGMQDYARRFGLDYIEITDLTDQPHKCGNKYAYAEVAQRYEQSLWLDTDVVVMDNAPNIFDVVPVGSWALTDDLPGLHRGNNYEWFNNEWKQLADALGLEAYDVPHAWNSGVVVAPRNAAKSYHPPPVPVPNFWCVEQHYHTRCLLDDKANVVSLERAWDVGYWDPVFTEHLDSGYFIHLGGCKPHALRLELLEHFAAGKRYLPEFKTRPDWLPNWLKPSPATEHG